MKIVVDIENREVIAGIADELLLLKKASARDDRVLPATRAAMFTALKLIQGTMASIVTSSTISREGTLLRAVASPAAINIIDAFEGEYSPKSSVAAMLDEGYGPFDMKIKMLQSPRAKTSKPRKRGEPAGKYIRIRFRMGKPGTRIGQEQMTERVYTLAKALGYAGKGGRGLDMPGYGRRSTLTPRVLGLKPHTWKSGLYHGLRKEGQPTDTQYATYRTISSRSNPSSWIHPGVNAKRFKERTVEATKTGVAEIIGKGFSIDLETLFRANA